MSGSKGPLSGGGLAAIADQRFLGNFTGAPATPAATQIVQGSNITLTPGAGTLTIAASGTSLSSITTGFIFANFSGGAAAPQGVELLAGTGITFSGTTTSLTITSSGGGGSPTVVQTATDRSTTSSDTTLSLTFGGNTTVGNYLVFMVSGFSNLAGSGAVSVAGVDQFFFRDRGGTVANQGFWVFVDQVESATTSYTVTLTNAPSSVVAYEVNNLNKIDARVYAPNIATATVSTTLTIQKGALNVFVIESDNDTGAIVAQTTGLTTVFSGHGATNHAAYFFTASDTLQGKDVSIQFTNNPSGGTIAAQVTLAV